ncbi:helix-turn-helix domain-containing protein [Burkholderia cenocepacia]|uniref:DNA-binding protein n=1 Tax=Burkholderia cenocepacia TaxID=95486 RepID=A0A1V2W3H8_9BURK|nr:helix-turn-helix transcriptional regulator [Burkholderia cenocepacia]MBR8248636.1 helix-turn-helix domain-containing protein [Burkholderia cenocepacia]MBR8288810.1 helix-turn-helix domain-containing protein [Burkholderia cenocepacia]MBR8498562.1 helix-turn-helix domain-containing protein [Burkholderia cenocepacia]ONJ13654.1 DNA-binding protein [Burkholderia cenocepacia]ONJ30242.1 DNA-binding protein [Burkholderia cenocepacia]
MKLGELLKSRREALGMTLDDVADATGSSKSYVWELEAGRSYKMGLPLAARFAVALGLQVSMMAASALESEANAARAGDAS